MDGGDRSCVMVDDGGPKRRRFGRQRQPSVVFAEPFSQSTNRFVLPAIGPTPAQRARGMFAAGADAGKPGRGEDDGRTRYDGTAAPFD